MMEKDKQKKKIDGSKAITGFLYIAVVLFLVCCVYIGISGELGKIEEITDRKMRKLESKMDADIKLLQKATVYLIGDNDDFWNHIDEDFWEHEHETIFGYDVVTVPDK